MMTYNLNEKAQEKTVIVYYTARETTPVGSSKEDNK